MVTSLYLMKVLPASTPSAALKAMVMVGPSFRARWIAMPRAITAARIGMIHTTEMRRRFLRSRVASGSSFNSVSLGMTHLVRFSGIPDQTRIEGLGRQHGEHHHRREEQHPLTRRDGHQGLQLHQRHGERVGKYI